MSLSRDSRQERKWKAWRRMQFALKQRFERIDFEEDVLGPEIEQIKAGKSVMGLPEGAAFDIQVDYDTPVHGQNADAGDKPDSAAD